MIILKNIVNEKILELRNKGVNAIITRESKKLSSASSDVFTWTNDPAEAAGVLLLDVEKRGRASFAYMIKAIQIPGIPCPEQKIRMMLDGHYEGITLFTDHGRTLWWNPSKRNKYRIKSAHQGNVPDGFWSW